AEVHRPQVIDIEEAILHRDVDIVRDRLPDAGNHLPRETGVAVVEDRALIREATNVVEVDASDTDTAADEAADAVIVAEIEHAVDHEAQRTRATATGRRGERGDGITNDAPGGRAPTRRADREFDIVDAGPLVGHFGL